MVADLTWLLCLLNYSLVLCTFVSIPTSRRRWRKHKSMQNFKKSTASTEKDIILFRPGWSDDFVFFLHQNNYQVEKKLVWIAVFVSWAFVNSQPFSLQSLQEWNEKKRKRIKFTIERSECEKITVVRILVKSVKTNHCGRRTMGLI